MNNELIDRFFSPMTEENRQAILKQIAQTPSIDSMFVEKFIGDREVTTKISNLAVSYMHTAYANISNKGTWEGLVHSTLMTDDLNELMKHPAIISYTQTVLLIALALMEKKVNGTEEAEGQTKTSPRK